MRKITLFLALIFCTSLVAQKTRKVLFLGNSYTSYNNMPQIVADLASSTGDVLIHDQNTPGGHLLGYHTSDPVTLQKLAVGDWDYVTLQEQSQFPASKNYRLLYSIYMDSLIKHNSACATTLFYMTWGRKNGNTITWDWPYPGTYLGMDSLIRLRYMMMADTNNAEVSPVGAVWRYIRQNHPSIELYQSDESHPSLAGSYAAACAFYTTIFRKDPTLATFNSSLSAATADTIRMATKHVVYDSLANWNIGAYDHLKGASCPKFGLNENPASKTWTTFPNPVVDKLTITLPEGSPALYFEIYSANGIRVYSNVISKTQQISLSHLTKGVYYLKAVNTDSPVRSILIR